MAHLTYAEAGVVGLIQGITELFPVSSLGHNVLLPALVGGQWAKDLNVSAPESPYLAYIVGLHVATALAMILYFWRDWARIIAAFFSSFRQILSPAPGTERWEFQTTDQQLAWMIVLATIPVGIAGLALEHLFRVAFSKPIPTALFLFANGLILLAGERVRRRRAGVEAQQLAADSRLAAERHTAAVTAGGSGPGSAARHSSGQRALKQQEAGMAVQADRRLVRLGYPNAIVIGSLQILALLPGISRDGVVMVGGMFRGLTRLDAARFSFLLSAPVILAAGMLKVPDLTGPLAHGIHGQVLFGSMLSFVGAYLALRFLMRYLSNVNRTLTPFAIYSLCVGLGAAIYLSVR
ncbi:MAG: undecaprenyl-diphosphate phosphatase [Streptosporangiaceae bacterium]|nr:undecaprenyl-diphosphate phosphatase [Streptosporangiaceae bacterium]